MQPDTLKTCLMSFISIYTFTLQSPSVKMNIFVLLEVMKTQVEWKFVIITFGEQYVMISGVSRMLGWCADNLDYHQHVSICTELPNLLTKCLFCLSLG